VSCAEKRRSPYYEERRGPGIERDPAGRRAAARSVSSKSGRGHKRNVLSPGHRKKGGGLVLQERGEKARRSQRVWGKKKKSEPRKIISQDVKEHSLYVEVGGGEWDWGTMRRGDRHRTTWGEAVEKRGFTVPEEDFHPSQKEKKRKKGCCVGRGSCS